MKVIYSLRMLNPGAQSIGDLKAVNARVAGYIWGHYRENVASFAVGNEPDWHDYHTYPGHPLDPAIYEHAAGLPGSQAGDARGSTATLGGAAITADTSWDGTWSTLPADPGAGISLTVRAPVPPSSRSRAGPEQPAAARIPAWPFPKRP